MLLRELPAKTFRHVLKSVTWTEVDVAFPMKNPLRRFVGRVAHPIRWMASFRNRHYVVIRDRVIDRLLKSRRAVVRCVLNR
jgi:hypothetical protein